MFDYDTNNIQNRAWYEILKYKAGHGELEKSEMVNWTKSYVASVIFKQNWINF